MIDCIKNKGKNKVNCNTNNSKYVFEKKAFQLAFEKKINLF